MKDLLKLFKQHAPVEQFDSIKIGLAVEVLNEDEEQVMFAEDGGEDVPQLGVNLMGPELADDFRI